MKTFARTPRFLSLLLVLASSWCRAEDPFAVPRAGIGPRGGKAAPESSEIGDLLDRQDDGTRFRLANVADPAKPIDPELFWRSVGTVVSARTTPVDVRLDDAEVIAPQTRLVGGDANRSAVPETVYPTTGRSKLTAGPHTLQPGNIPLRVNGGSVSSDHPAIKVNTGSAVTEVLILCAPVRLEVVDSQGRPVSARLKVAAGDKSLLRQDADFASLEIWLPVGASYSSSLGDFRLSATGQLSVTPARLPPGVEQVANGLRRTIAAPAVDAAAASSTNLVRVPVGGKPGSAFDVFVPPVSPVSGPIWLAVSKSKYEQATGHALPVEQCTAHWWFDGPGDPLRQLAAGAGPGGPVGAAAVNELGVDSADLVWLALPLFTGAYGPVLFHAQLGPKESLSGSALVADVAEKINLVPYRWRTAFAETETAFYNVILRGDMPATSGRLVIQADQPGAKAVEIGQLTLPAVDSGRFDSRLVRLTAGDLPAGHYQLRIEAGGTRSAPVPLQVVAWHRQSPFLVHAMSCCVACWPTDDAGLERLRAAGLEMGTVSGANSLLTDAMPALDAGLARRLATWNAGIAPEFALRATGNDVLLGRMVRHGFRFVDLTVCRAAGFYNEGLSYHHSYGPSVDRMVRRMQIFTQQTGDYASFWGVNYNWFPALGGYVEGGVPTDAHTGDRMRALEQTVAAAGFKPLTRDESKWLKSHTGSTDSVDGEKVAALSRQATDYWRALQDYGFGKHNELYNAAVREVRPDTVATLFENAGHDAGKRTRALFHDMSAICYETYTDYGDWPMSCAFAVDWSRGNLPNKPVWLTTNWGTTTEGGVKTLFHAFARGLAGGGMPMPADIDPLELDHRGRAMRFIAQYGALARDAKPDARVAILSSTVRQALTPQGMWQLHALYYHLTRLGVPPVLLADEDLAAGAIPAGLQALFVLREEAPLEPQTRTAIERFMAHGGRVIAADKSASQLPGAIVVDVPIKHLWEMKGFQAAAHAEMWQEFEEHWRAPLAAALRQARIEPLAATDVDRGLALPLSAGPLRYVVVIADARGSHSGEFQRPGDLPVSVTGEGWIIRDLVKQQTLAAKSNGGLTDVSVDLTTEPATILACCPAAPQIVDLTMAAGPKLGAPLQILCNVIGGTGATPTDLGHVPLAFTLTGPDGQERRSWYEAAGVRQTAALPALDVPGKWQLTVQEELTGLTAVADFTVAAAKEPNTAAQVGDVFVPNEAHLRGFVARPEEKLIIVEPGQQHLLNVAQELASSLAAAGKKVRVWQVRPEEFDTAPLRWYPRAEDTARLAAIAAGRLIGYRGNLQPYIDKIKRAHVPELGGYHEIAPPYMVGRDCIVFSGGRLAESLRAVTCWMDTPDAPGRGQARLVVCFSPFMAQRQALAVVANDRQGFSKAVEQLAAAARQSPASAGLTAKAAGDEPLVAVPARLEARQLVSSYRNYSPRQRVVQLLANRAGQSALVLDGQQDDLAFVDERGQVTATVALDNLVKTHLQLDERGLLHGLRKSVLASDPSWHFPSEIELLAETMNGQGKRIAELPVYRGETYRLPPDFEAGFSFRPDGRMLTAGRPGWLLFGSPGNAAWRGYEDLPHVTKRYEQLWPRQPVGATWSPDGRFLLLTMDSRPPFGGLGSPAPQPTSSETLLLDVEQNQRVWALHDPAWRQAPYAVHRGFAAVASEGRCTAIAGYDGAILLVDRGGKILLRDDISSGQAKFNRLGPPDGVGVWIAESGSLAAFGFKSLLVLARGGELVRLPQPGLLSACVARDGSLAVAAVAGGRVAAVDPQGAPQWTLELGGAGCHVAGVGDNKTLIATGDGELLLVDAAGKQLWRTAVAEIADRDKHPIVPVADLVRQDGIPEYHEPNTLSLAKERLSARQIAAWSASSAGHPAWGRKFYVVDRAIELAAPAKAEGEFFLHLVYRRPAGNKSLQVTVNDRDGKRTFVLDLPTPNYRVVDLPLRGAGAAANVIGEGPVEVAECSLWSFQWPGGNLAYIKPAGSEAVAGVAPAKSAAAADDILAELENRPQQALGRMKDCKIYFPNADPDQVAGPYLRAPVDPTQMVDGRSFEQLPPWGGQNPMQAPTRGAFLTVDLSESPVGLLATYDRAWKQSDVAENLAIFTTEALDPVMSGQVITGAAGNDQFWRLFALGKLPPQSLGIHLFSGARKAVGLSELEAYR